MQTTEFLTIGQVADRLGIPRWRLAYLIERRAVPGPSSKVPGRRLFSSEDVAAVQAGLAKLESPEPASN